MIFLKGWRLTNNKKIICETFGTFLLSHCIANISQETKSAALGNDLIKQGAGARLGSHLCCLPTNF